MITDELKYRIRSVFGHVPTEEQEHAIDVFAMFMTDHHEHAVMVMRGSAGTGKTTLAAAIVRAMQSLQQKIILLAPTGRAAKVFSLYSNHPAYTIHRRIYRQKSLEGAFELNYNMAQDTLFHEFVFEVNDETCIDEIKRETLTRQFNPSSLNVVSFNGEKKSYPGFITNPDRNYSQFCKDAKKLSLKKKLFQESIDEKIEKKNFPEDSVRVGLDKEKYKLFKRIYNISLDDKCFGNDEGIKNSKCEITKRNANSLKSGEIYNQLFFNNNKKILLHQKNKNVYKNTIS